MDTKKMQNTLPELKILVDEPLANYTYTKTGGPADALVFPKNRQELKEVVHYANMEGISWQVLGNASNLIVRDSGIR